MWQALHYHSTAASIKVCSFNAVSICLCPVQPWFIGRYAVGPANCLRHNAGDVGTVHPAAVDARCTITPVCPKHQAKRNISLVVRVKGACGLLRKTSDLWEHRTSLLAWAPGLEAAPPLKNWPECVSGLHQSWTPGRETVRGWLQEWTPVTDVAVVVLTCGYLDFVSTSIHPIQQPADGVKWQRLHVL